MLARRDPTSNGAPSTTAYSTCVTDQTPVPSPRPLSLILASIGSILTGFVFVAVGVGSLLQGHGMLSAGVGAMLMIYGCAVGAIGWAAWTRHLWSLGAVIASALLHLAVAVSTASGSRSVAVALAGIVPLVVVSAALTPATRRALNR